MGWREGLGDAIEQKTHTFCELVGRWEETDDQPGHTLETEEVSGVDGNPTLLEKLQTELLLAENRWHAQDRVPPAADGPEEYRRVF